MNRAQRSKLLFAAACASFAIACTGNLASAQLAPAPAPAPSGQQFKNLQVLPKDISRDQIFPIMKGFAQGLGVRCTHCHVGTEGQPLSTFDFASDAKSEKLKARAMLRMVHRINEEDFGVRQPADIKVTCYTCHRGATKPLTAAPSPPPAPPAS